MVKQNRTEVTENATFRQVCDFYLNSQKFLNLTNQVQKSYEQKLESACTTKVQNGKQLGRIKVKDIRYKHMELAYETWVTERGIRAASYIAACVSIVLNTAIRNEIMTTNYMGLVPKISSKPRKVKWTQDQVKLFLDTAYSQWAWRSIGLIAHMAYEWGQRVGDMRMLTWDNINFEGQRLDLTQSKRGVDVHIPISDNLTAMLKKQKEDFGFQPYVAPRVTPRAGAYTPYDREEVAVLVNQVKKAAGLPDEIQVRDMRRTAITEMVEAGVDLAGIMQVSGHQSAQSVTPYLVNTYSGAKAALDKRWNNK